MSESGQSAERTPLEPWQLEDLPQAVAAHARDFPAGHCIPPHSHRRAQLVYASAGVMTVTTAAGAFVVPPNRAVWLPALVEHRIDTRGPLAMRTLYIRPDATPGLPTAVCVLQVSPLLRELILAAVAARQVHAPGGAEDRLMQVILDQIRALPAAPLALPMPSDRRLRKVTDGLLADPADARGLDDWAQAAGASGRTLARLFLAETGLTFRAWRQQLRLLRGLEMLAAGEPVTTVAFDLGYDSPSAFIAMFRRALGTSPTRYFERSERRGRPAAV